VDLEDLTDGIRRRRSGEIPGSAAVLALRSHSPAGRDLAADLRAALCALEVASAELAAAFDGELDRAQPDLDWLVHLASKARSAEQAAARVAKTAELAADTPPSDDPPPTAPGLRLV
jgi:hypothetical protein